MSLRIALIGKTGQLARAILHEAEDLGYQVTALDRTYLDLSISADKIEPAIFDFLVEFDVLILAAAYTNVDGAETDTTTAHAVNAIAPHAIARACERRSIPMIHISTDYVFGGNSKTPYKPNDETNPLGVYGASKLAGEIAVLKTNARVLILRTSWVFDGTGRNFLTTMLRLSETHETLSVVNDQVGRPTFAGDLARATIRAAEAIFQDKNIKSRVYHVTNVGAPISWAEFAVKIFQVTNRDVVVKDCLLYTSPSPRD